MELWIYYGAMMLQYLLSYMVWSDICWVTMDIFVGFYKAYLLGYYKPYLLGYYKPYLLGYCGPIFVELL